MEKQDSVPRGKEATLEAIMSRKSVREFSGEKASSLTRRAVLEAGMAAPSAHGRKPWRFSFIDDERIRECIVASFPWFKPALGSDFNILVSGNPSLCAQSEYWTVDCAAATENILLAARALGLGSVWMGIAPVEENIRRFKELIELPEGLVPFSLVALGRPKDTAAFGTRREAWSDGLLVEAKLREAT
jgi:nitroreductase